MGDFNLRPIWVTPEFRQYLIDNYNLGDQDDMALFAWFIIHGKRDDAQPGYIVVPRDLIRQLYGSRAYLQDTLNAWVKRTGIPLHILDANRWKHEATSVFPDLPADLLKVLADAVDTRRKDKKHKVDLLTGTRWTRYRERKELEAQVKIAEQYIRDLPPSPTKPLLEYLHSPRVRKAVRRLVVENGDQMDAAISGLRTDEDRARANGLRLAVESTLLAYTQASRSPRIYAVGANLMQFKREVRKSIYAGCWYLDQKSAQAVYASELWGVESLRRVVASEDLWGHLAGDMGLQFDTEGDKEERGKRNEELKDKLKTCFYCAVFGGGVAKMLEKLNDKYPGREDEVAAFVKRFRSVPWVTDVFKARDERLREIIRTGKITDAWGVEWRRDWSKDAHREARSLLAREIQSYEVKTMLAGYEAIAADPDMLLVGWLHDGIYVMVTNNKATTDSKISKVKKAIEVAAQVMGFNELRVEKTFIKPVRVVSQLAA